MKFQQISIFLLLSVLLATFAPAQQNQIEQSDETFLVDGVSNEQPKLEIRKLPTKTEIDSVVLIINFENINKVLVVSTVGEWIPDAREVTIKTSIAGDNAPELECVMCKVLFKPTSPEKKTWKLASVITANVKEFQEVLDGLQKGEFAPPGSTPTK